MRPALPEYPWDALRPLQERAAAHPEGLIDLSIGSPVDATPAVVAEALSSAANAPSYPLTSGSATLREDIADWYRRRRNVQLSAQQVLPTVGSKELVALLPVLLGLSEDDVIVYPRVAYPTYAMSAALAGVAGIAADDPQDWPESTRLIWLNSPSNPTGAVLSHERLATAVARARALGAIIVNDECYAELGWQPNWEKTATPCILHPDVVGESLDGVLSVYSLSKQSNMAGYRAAMLAGDPAIVSTLLTSRKHAGLIVPAPIQAAMSAALRDDHHVAEQKARYAKRRAQLLPALEQAGFQLEHSEAGLYLWMRRDDSCWTSLEYLADRGILAGPGVFYGEDAGAFVRIALTASDGDIATAAQRLLT